ncbi:hypothetical protein [Zymomonas mobilis]|nr:hypothetical protein [Zymomonas mobilis]
MTRTVNSIFNFHTPNNKKVFILKNKILEVDNLLELYGEKSKKDCYLTNNKDYVSLSIEGRDLPLVIIWNDASDKVVVGFDGSIKKNEDLYLPPVFINSDFIKELSPKSLNLTCNKK